MDGWVVVLGVALLLAILLSVINDQMLYRRVLRKLKELHERIQVIEELEEARKLSRDSKGRYRRRVTDIPQDSND